MRRAFRAAKQDCFGLPLLVIHCSYIAPCRMMTKIEEMIKDLETIHEKIKETFNNGIVDGLSRASAPQRCWLFRTVKLSTSTFLLPGWKKSLGTPSPMLSASHCLSGKEGSHGQSINEPRSAIESIPSLLYFLGLWMQLLWRDG